MPYRAGFKDKSSSFCPKKEYAKLAVPLTARQSQALRFFEKISTLRVVFSQKTLTVAASSAV
jgi:hypothetical protein